MFKTYFLMFNNLNSKFDLGLSIVKILACSVLTFLASYIIKGQCEIVFLIVFTGSLLINIIVNLKTKLFDINIGSILLYSSIFIWILSIGILGIINGVSFTLYEVISLVIILVTYLIIELIVKKVASIN